MTTISNTTTATTTTTAVSTATSKLPKRAGNEKLNLVCVASWFSTAEIALIKWPHFITGEQLATKSVDSIGHAVDTFVAQAINGLPDTAELFRQLAMVTTRYQRAENATGVEAVAYTLKHVGNCFQAYRPESNRQVKAMVKNGYDIATSLEILTAIQPASHAFMNCARRAASAARKQVKINKAKAKAKAEAEAKKA